MYALYWKTVGEELDLQEINNERLCSSYVKDKVMCSLISCTNAYKQTCRHYPIVYAKAILLNVFTVPFNQYLLKTTTY